MTRFFLPVEIKGLGPVKMGRGWVIHLLLTMLTLVGGKSIRDFGFFAKETAQNVIRTNWFSGLSGVGCPDWVEVLGNAEWTNGNLAFVCVFGFCFYSLFASGLSFSVK